MGRALGVINTSFTSGEHRFVARIHTPGRPLRFSFVLAPGATTASVDGERRRFRIDGGHSAVLSVPSAVANIVPPHSSIRNLCILADRSVVEDCLRDSLTGAPAGVLRALEEHSDPYSHISGITPRMQVVIDQIHSSPYTGGLKRLYLEAKCLELMSMRLAQLCAEEPATTHPPLRRADIDRIHEARDLLTVHCTDPPSLREIALMVGMNCNKLKYGFREVFGETVFGYLRSFRLEQARRLLREGDCSVTEVAYRVGYNSLSHFARIFRERYGISPHLYPRQNRFHRAADHE
ncbi:MAG: helix-turn-helix transcriptional regulator [Spirochaetota bacterium]